MNQNRRFLLFCFVEENNLTKAYRASECIKAAPSHKVHLYRSSRRDGVERTWVQRIQNNFNDVHIQQRTFKLFFTKKTNHFQIENMQIAFLIGQYFKKSSIFCFIPLEICVSLENLQWQKKSPQQHRNNEVKTRIEHPSSGMVG